MMLEHGEHPRINSRYSPRKSTDRKIPHLTRNQRMVFDKLNSLGRSVGAYEILDHLRPEGVNAIPTIYRALNALMAKGLVRHIASTKCFVVSSTPSTKNQASPLFICEVCEGVAPIDSEKLAIAVEDNAAQSGFQITSSCLEVVGICTRCSTQR